MAEVQEELVDLSIVIPDAIEPVVGWKGMNLLQDGRLMSPTYTAAWEAGKPFEAECSGIHGIWEWKPYPSISATGTPEHQVGENWLSLKPQIILPPGMEWRLDFIATDHEVAGAGCTCGVYIAGKGEASAYGNILIEVAGWGTTTSHGRGWRTQFAYPKKIHVRNERQKKLIIDYGVPVEVMPKDEARGSSEAAMYRFFLILAAILLVGGTFETAIWSAFPSSLTLGFSLGMWIVFFSVIILLIILDQVND